MDKSQVIERMIEWFQEHEGKVTYSMEYRTGETSYDCSSAVYYAVCYALELNPKYPFNTESEHDFLLAHNFELIADNTIWDSERGDIFILGRIGYSSGEDGHTGVYIDANNIIHCNYSRNGITIDNADSVLSWQAYGWYAYRYKGQKKEEENVTKQISKQYVIVGNYSIDNLPWFLDDKNKVGETKDYIGYVVTISRKWNNYWYSQYLNGFVDHRAFKEIESIDQYKTIQSSGYSVDTLPWGMNGYRTIMKSDELIGKKFHITAKLGSYLYLSEIAKWVDKKAFIKDLNKIAQEVLEGKFGNGKERENKIRQLGYSYKEVQEKVNEILKK